MSSPESPCYRDYTRNSTEFFKRLAHRTRLESAAAMVPLSKDMKILDYGCGDGHLFSYLANQVPRTQLVGYEPFLLDQMTEPDIRTHSNVGELVALHRDSFDVVFCLEVCEHLTADAMIKLFRHIRECGKDSATYVFGVPIETGLSGFAKGIYRTLKGGRQNATLGRSIKALISSSIPRAHDADGWIGSHTGFDTLYFIEQLRYGGFNVLHRRYLPWPWLGSLMNNEVYLICERNERHRTAPSVVEPRPGAANSSTRSSVSEAASGSDS